jgi:hypothetical protein
MRVCGLQVLPAAQQELLRDMDGSIDLQNQFVTETVSRDVVVVPNMQKHRHYAGKDPVILTVVTRSYSKYFRKFRMHGIRACLDEVAKRKC